MIQFFKINNKEFFTCDLEGADEAKCFQKAQEDNKIMLKEAEKRNSELKKKMKNYINLSEKNTENIVKNRKVIDNF
tara:strand:- start:13 stop:240 length:228 start_codon:yes stop_codon:yes gene_type:complete